MAGAVTETPLERACVWAARKRGVWGLKSEPMYSGFPDRMFLGPDCRVAFVEFKTEVGELRPNQVDAHDVLRRLGWTVAVIRTKAEFQKFLDEWLT